MQSFWCIFMVNKTSPGGRGGQKIEKRYQYFSKKGFLRGGGQNVAKGGDPKQKPSYAPDWDRERQVPVFLSYVRVKYRRSQNRKINGKIDGQRDGRNGRSLKLIQNLTTQLKSLTTYLALATGTIRYSGFLTRYLIRLRVFSS